jgi:hypothetical protein
LEFGDAKRIPPAHLTRHACSGSPQARHPLCSPRTPFLMGFAPKAVYGLSRQDGSLRERSALWSPHVHLWVLG